MSSCYETKGQTLRLCSKIRNEQTDAFIDQPSLFGWSGNLKKGICIDLCLSHFGDPYTAYNTEKRHNGTSIYNCVCFKKFAWNIYAVFLKEIERKFKKLMMQEKSKTNQYCKFKINLFYFNIIQIFFYKKYIITKKCNQSILIRKNVIAEKELLWVFEEFVYRFQCLHY